MSLVSLALGLIAALAWGVHDFLVRFLGGGLIIPSALLIVLSVGTAVTLPIAIVSGGWSGLTVSEFSAAMGSGLAYALGSYCLYRAFADGPVRLVAPIIGAYPVITVALAWLSGKAVPVSDWLAVAVIVTGVGLVARLSGAGDGTGQRRRAAVNAAISGIAFAAAFALAQSAASGSADWPAIMVIRAVAIAGVVAFLLTVHRGPVAPQTGQLPVLGAMGFLDAAALSLVTVAGSLPNPEYAAVVTSIFGVVTVILAHAILHERMTTGQWFSVFVVFSGVAMLGL